MKLWRLSNHTELDGVGGLVSSGRWHPKGVFVAYLAEHPALAILETLVHLEVGDLDEIPDTYTLSRVDALPQASIQELGLTKLPAEWTNNTALTQALGFRWLRANDSVLLKVPSAVAPASFNYLYNPAHPAAASCSVGESRRQPWDRRLFKI